MPASRSTIVPAEHRGVERRAAGDEHHPLDGAYGVGREAHVGQDHVAGLGRDAAAERVGDGARLLVHLLEHEVPVAALLGHDRIPEDPHRLAPDGSPSRVDSSTESAVTTATSSSSSMTTSRVWDRIAGMSEATNISPCPSPTTTLPAPCLAAINRSGAAARDDADGVRSPDLCSAAFTARSSRPVVFRWCSMRWASTSVSVSDLKR